MLIKLILWSTPSSGTRPQFARYDANYYQGCFLLWINGYILGTLLPSYYRWSTTSSRYQLSSEASCERLFAIYHQRRYVTALQHTHIPFYLSWLTQETLQPHWGGCLIVQYNMIAHMTVFLNDLWMGLRHYILSLGQSLTSPKRNLSTQPIDYTNL